MARSRHIKIALGAMVAVAAVAAEWVLAQTASIPTAPPVAAPTEAPASQSGGLLLGAIFAVFLALLTGVIRLYDMKRRQEESAMILQAKLSDALLLDPSLSAYPITATVHAPLRRRSRITIDIAGTVPTAELRQAVLDIVKRQTTGIGREVHIEDRMVINRAIARYAA